MWGIDDYIALVVEVTDGVKPHIAKKKTLGMGRSELMYET